MNLRGVIPLGLLAAFNACQHFASLQTFPAQQRISQLQAESLSYRTSQSPRDPVDLIQRYHRELFQRAPEQIRLKYQAMAESPFAFYRATAFLFYFDMARQGLLSSSLKIWIQGDFHLENMGTYRTASGRYSYDLNDFDEATQAPYTWELARMAVSVQLAAAESKFTPAQRQELVRHFLNRYLYHLQQVAQQPEILARPIASSELSEKPAKQVAQAAHFERAAYLETMVQNAKLRLSEKMQAVTPSERQALEAALTAYAQKRKEGLTFFRLKDVATRIAGKGSLGRYRYVALVEGPSENPWDDVLLELKEAAAPASEAFMPSRSNPAIRIVQAFYYFLPEADPYLGDSRLFNLPVYVRELLPKETVNLKKLNTIDEYQAFLDTVALIAARAHARSGQVSRIQAESPQWLSRLPAWSEQYVLQVFSDWQVFRQALQQRQL